MRTLSRIAFNGVFLIGVFSSHACGREHTPGKAIVVLFDLSESTDKPEVRTVYCRNFERILSTLDHGDALAAGWITEASAAQLELPIDERLPEFDAGTTNSFVVRARRAKADTALMKAKASFHSGMCEKLGKPGRKVWKTDIMTSLDLADRITGRYGPRTRKVVVIMSDMIEDSERYDFKKLDLNAERTRQIIASEKNDGRLPDLAGVEVCVAGASAPHTRQFDKIREFWKAYFAASGGELVDYGGPLVRCLQPRTKLG